MVSTCLMLIASAAAPAKTATDANAAFDKAMQPILAAYLTIQTSLAADKMDGVTDAAKTIAKLAAALDVTKLQGEYAKQYKDLPQKLVQAAQAFAKETAIAPARQSFKELSKPMALWGTLSKPEGIAVAYCSMAPGGWLQKAGELRNPYYGAAMLTCGEVVGGAGAAKK